jgi:hypothetical protein
VEFFIFTATIKIFNQAKLEILILRRISRKNLDFFQKPHKHKPHKHRFKIASLTFRRGDMSFKQLID